MAGAFGRRTLYAGGACAVRSAACGRAAPKALPLHACHGDDKCRLRTMLVDLENPNRSCPDFCLGYGPPAELRIPNAILDQLPSLHEPSPPQGDRGIQRRGKPRSPCGQSSDWSEGGSDQTSRAPRPARKMPGDNALPSPPPGTDSHLYKSEKCLRRDKIERNGIRLGHLPSNRRAPWRPADSVLGPEKWRALPVRSSDEAK